MHADLIALTVFVATVMAASVARPRPFVRRPSPPQLQVVLGHHGDVHHRVAHIITSRGRRRTVRPESVAEWCDDLSRRVRAGSSLTVALAESVPGNDDALVDATGGLRRALARGRPVADAVSALASVDSRTFRGAQHLALACSIIAVSARVGGSPASPLDRVAASLRQRAVDRQERATHAAQAQMSARVLTIVPLAMLTLLVATDSDVRDVITQPVGALCVTLGLVLNVTGFVWMHWTIGTGHRKVSVGDRVRG